MWTRKELKERAKTVFKANYWKCVLAALVMALVMGGGNFSADFDRSDLQDVRKIQRELTENGSLIGKSTEETDQMISQVDEIGQKVAQNIEEGQEKHGENFPIVAAILIVAVVFVVIVIVLLIAGCIDVFLLNPLQIGCMRFFVQNLYEKAQPKEIGFAFTNHYKENVKAMFLVDLKCILWGLLFIIPGVIKSYEYRMVPYLMGQEDAPDAKEALIKSSEMMHGQKWAAFVLDLSFLGWNLLAILTCGLVGLFYTNPYEFQTDAALFDVLNGSKWETPAVNSDAEYETYIEM